MRQALLFLLALDLCPAFGQVIDGPTTVEVGETHRYVLDDQVTYAQPTWDETLCSRVTYGHSGNYFIDLTFTEGTGTATIAFLDGSTSVASLQITVNATPPTTPSTSYTTTYNCGNTVIHYNVLVPGLNFEWWWQTASNGTSTSLGTAESITRTSSGDLYLRARLKANPFTWSSGSLHIGNVVVYTSPPAAPTVANHATRFGPGQLTVSTEAVSGALKYAWYTTSSGGIPISGQTTTSYILLDVASDATYYVSSLNGCESSRLAVNAIVLPMPTIVTTTSSGRSINMGESVTLGTSTSYDGYAWKNAGGGTVGTSSTYTTSATGVFTVVVEKTGAVNSGTSDSFAVFDGHDGLNMNFVTTNAIQVPGITSAAGISSLNVNQNTQSTQFVDGLGRPVQSVVTQGSPAKRDLVQPVVYDSLGREHRKYLPVAPNRINGWFNRGIIGSDGLYSGPATNFYNNSSDKIADDEAPFAETIFESSPLNRPLKLGSPGTVWQPLQDPAEMDDKTLKNSYETNLSGQILNLVFNPNTGALTCGVGTVSHYPAGSLSVVRVTDEQGNETVEYKNNKGQVICKAVQYATISNVRKYAKTYYVYDDLGNLILVIQPEGMKQIDGDN